MKAAAEELQTSLRRSRVAFAHRLTSGESTEAAVRQFLRENYPESIGVAHGQVIDSGGDQSGQLDVIMYDKARTPILFSDREQGNRLVPAEGVLAAMDVKHSVSSADLTKAAADAKKLKRLKRNAYFNSVTTPLGSPQNLYGRTWPVVPPPLFLVFAFEGPTLETTTATLRAAHEGATLHERVDMTCILNRGTTMNITPDGQSVTVDPRPGTELKGYAAGNPLLTTHILLSTILLQMYVPPINVRNYLPDNFGL